MFRAVHPEVLAPDWLPPVPLGRRGPLAALVRWLSEPLASGAPNGAAAVIGPRGSGSSTLARLAARAWTEARPATGALPRPLLATVRVPEHHGAHGVAGALLRALDPDYELRGFPVSELMAGFLRQLRRAQRPTVVVLDDVGPAAPELSRLVSGLIDPGAYLPEGTQGLPPLALLVAGSSETARALGKGALAYRLLDRATRLLPYTEPELTTIVLDRAQRALGRPVPVEWVSRIVRRTARDQFSASRAVELLRRELIGREMSELGPVYHGSDPPAGLEIESPLLGALGQLEEGVPVRVGELHALATGLARTQGEPPMPATTFWRRILRLERAGLVRRTVRTGGAGGSLSTIAVVRPVGDWPSTTERLRTPRAGGSRSVPFPLWAAPLEEAWDPVPRERREVPSALPFGTTDDGSV
jgi:hypothetical protein